MIWVYIIGGATIFALIVGIFSAYNGRATRRYIGNLIKEGNRSTQELIQKEMEANREILHKIANHLLKISQGQGELLKRLPSRKRAR